MAMANDSMEGKLLAKLLRDFAESEGWGHSEIEALDASFEESFFQYFGYCFCMSAERDRLSQWRGYASDGTGVAIGFNRRFLGRWAEKNLKDLGSDAETDPNPMQPKFSLEQVIYDSERQKDLVTKTLGALKKGFPSPLTLMNMLADPGSALKAKEAGERYREEMRGLMSYLHFTRAYVLKSDAFEEEREWRLIARSGFENVEFHASGGRLIPFLTLDIPTDIGELIDEVVLGPKCSTPPEFISQCLIRYGHDHVAVGSSRASYR
jgi:hypothetical protein